MANESKYNTLKTHIESALPEKVANTLKLFLDTYTSALQKAGIEIATLIPSYETFLNLVVEQLRSPITFEPYHVQITAPFDYHRFGLEFIKPLIDPKCSTLEDEHALKEIESHLNRKDNVILFSNHQTEADPQIIKLLLEKQYPSLAQNMIFVAGERVITDPLAVPFSLGLNLLCIYSKRYIDYPPEDKAKKQQHNKRTMEMMSSLLKEGGKCIWVAPSGGRDRPNEKGIFEVAPFDSQSIEMFALMAQKAAHPTHFHPLAIKAYNLLPPPENVQIELGEVRQASRCGAHLAFGSEIKMENLVQDPSIDRQARRKMRAEHIHAIIKEMYERFK